MLTCAELIMVRYHRDSMMANTLLVRIRAESWSAQIHMVTKRNLVLSIQGRRCEFGMSGYIPCESDYDIVRHRTKTKQRTTQKQNKQQTNEQTNKQTNENNKQTKN